jgi:nicotinamide-nucleotide amidase
MDREIYDLGERLGKELQLRQMAVATAESCTGGWIAQALTMVPGSSAWFERGFVTYSDRSKQEMLGVRDRTLERDGAVSENTVREMAEGALARSHAHCSVAVSGIAGPDGGSPDKPVGTVWIAIASSGQATEARRLRLAGDREAVRRQTVIVALQALLDIVGRPLVA